MSQFKLSIITVVKNDQNNIVKTINSILEQKKDINLEYIVIDGKSSDNTFEIIKTYKSNIDKIISEKDHGIYDAMNKGISITTGNIVGFCNSGDVIFKNGLKIVIDVFEKNNCDFVFGTVLRNYTGNKIKKFGFDPGRIYYNFDFATSHSTGFYVKKKVIEQIGKFNLKYKCSSDYDFYYKLINSKKYLGSYTSEDNVIGEVASGGFSSTLSFYDHLLEETKIRLNNKQSIFVVGIIFINAIIKNCLKKIKSIAF